MTFEVIGVLLAGQLRTLVAQVVMITSLVLKMVFSGTTVVVGIMLDETMEPVMLCMELVMELELAVSLMTLMLL